MNKISFIAFSIFVLFSAKAEASIVWDWQFTNDFLSAAPTDSVTQKIRVFNNSTSGETLGVFGIGSPTAQLTGATIGGVAGYSISFPLDLFSDFGSPIAPGETRDTDFITYNPIGGVALAGHYFTGGQLIQLVLSTGGNNFAGLSRCYNWVVNNAEEDFCPNSPNAVSEEQSSTAIPEPATAFLLLTGLLAAPIYRRYLAI